MTNPENATIYCFCELHNRQDQHARIGELIARLYQPNDIVLIEGETGTLSSRVAKFYCKQYPGLTHQMQLEGWDSREALSAPEYEACCIKIETLYESVKNFREQGIDHKDALNELQKHLSPTQQARIEKEGLKEILTRKMIDLAKELHEFANGDSFVKRNQSLAQAIQTHQLGGKRIFAIAGKKHFFPISDINENVRRGQEIVRFVIEKHPYAILYSENPEPLPPSTAEIKENLSLLTRVKECLLRCLQWLKKTLLSLLTCSCLEKKPLSASKREPQFILEILDALRDEVENLPNPRARCKTRCSVQIR